LNLFDEDELTSALRVQYFELEGQRWTQLSQAERRDIAERIRRSPMVGASPGRFGLVEVVTNGTHVAGYLNQEWEESIETYDDSKARQTSEAVNSINIAFFLDLSDGLTVVQATRFARVTGLSPDLARRRFQATLNQTLFASGAGGVALRPLEAGSVVPKQRVWEIARNNRVIALEVTNVEGRSIEPEYPVFNPDPTPEEFYRDEIWARTAQNVESATMHASENGNLARVREARALMSAADTRAIYYQASDDGPVQSQRAWNGREEVPFPDPLTVERLDDLAQEVRERLPSNVVMNASTININLFLPPNEPR